VHGFLFNGMVSYTHSKQLRQIMYRLNLENWIITKRK